jgi:mannose-6-phosphate isomerase-like protein (cupin superfamily)
MEKANIETLEEYRNEKIVKKVPIMSDQLMVDVLFIASNAKDLTIEDNRFDWIYYVVKGIGRLTTVEGSHTIGPGMMFLALRGEFHVFSAHETHLTILSFRSMLNSKSGNTQNKLNKED